MSARTQACIAVVDDHDSLSRSLNRLLGRRECTRCPMLPPRRFCPTTIARNSTAW